MQNQICLSRLFQRIRLSRSSGTEHLHNNGNSMMACLLFRRTCNEVGQRPTVNIYKHTRLTTYHYLRVNTTITNAIESRKSQNSYHVTDRTIVPRIPSFSCWQSYMIYMICKRQVRERNTKLNSFFCSVAHPTQRPMHFSTEF